MNEITLRPLPLTPDETRKLDEAAEKYLSFRERHVATLVWEKDEYGDPVQRRRIIESGPEIFPKGDVPAALMDSLKRKAAPATINAHLARLAAHKPWARGPAAWAVILNDLTNDLAQVGEWAVIKTCEHYRRDPESTFFPDTAKFLKRARDLEFALRNVRPAVYPAPIVRKPAEPTAERNPTRVAEVLHDARIPHSREFCAQCKAEGEL